MAADAQVILWGCPKVLADDLEGLKHMAAELGVEADILGFMLYHSLWPSVARHIRSQDGPAPGQDLWDNGYCPMCGSQPMLALLGQEGNRSLVCGFCRHTWAVPRNFCPQCDDRRAKSMEYFFSDSEKEYRVYTCNNCKGYIKSVDLRELARPFYAPLEALLTTHLDLKAQQMGFHNSAPSWQTL